MDAWYVNRAMEVLLRARNASGVLLVVWRPLDTTQREDDPGKNP